MPHKVPEAAIGELLIRRQLTLVTAESCTGGLVAHLITNVPGSSEYFLGGVVAYSNELKQTLLGVEPETLEQYGAVSRETALAMARGARVRLGADIAVSATGIAGPGGGSAEKPIGLTWIAISTPHIEAAHCFMWAGNRQENKLRSAEAALKLVHDHLSGHNIQ